MKTYFIVIYIFYNIVSFCQHKIDFSLKRISIDKKHIVRITPSVDNIKVEGSDSIYTHADTPLLLMAKTPQPKGDFVLKLEEAIDKAIGLSAFSLLRTTKDLDCESYVEKIWLNHLSNLRPAYKIRLPVLLPWQLEDIYIDADNGDILKIEPAAQMLKAPSFTYSFSPSSYPPKKDSLKKAHLKHLTSIKENGALNGEFFDVRSCCQYYTCPEDGPCSEEYKRCALKSHQGAQYAHQIFELPTDSLGLSAIFNLPPTIFVDSIKCTNIGLAKAKINDEQGKVLGFFADPIDEPGVSSELDQFSEIQAYFSIQSFFAYIRSLLNDQTWCLRKEAMLCDKDGKILLDSNSQPIKKYKIYVNQLSPATYLEDNNSESIINQIHNNKGSKEQPAVLSSMMRVNNAAFVPALSSLKKTKPRADEILSDLIKPFDHNVFYQGDRDFAYDGDVVFHEFMHAVTATMVGKMNSLGLDSWGINAEPGSLNEGWSDYFAAAFTGHPILGEYAALDGDEGEVGKRNLENNFTCPTNIIGEVHNDSKIWSGALWQIREEIKSRYDTEKAFYFDQAVLRSLAMATNTDDFSLQGQKLLKNIKDSPKLNQEIGIITENILQKRGVLNCQRFQTLSYIEKNGQVLSVNKDKLFVPSKISIGIKNFAPSNSQLKINIPKNTKKIIISWKQSMGNLGPLLGKEATPVSLPQMKPLGIAVRFDLPIEWQFKSSLAVGLSEEIAQAQFEQNRWYYEVELHPNKCLPKEVYISLLGYDFQYQLEDIKADFVLDIDKNQPYCKTSKPFIKEGGCKSSPPSFLGLIFSFFILLWRNKNLSIRWRK